MAASSSFSSTDLSVTIRGRVEAVFYSSPKFSAGRLRTTEGDHVNFAGALMASVHDAVVLTGTWVVDPKYGRQLKVASFTFDQDLDASGLAHFLANHNEIRGIGPVKAERIALAFGTDFDRVIEHEPHRVAEVAKVSLEVADQLRTVWLQQRAFNAVATWLASFGLTHHQIKTLIEKYGNAAATALKHDPYLLVHDLPGFGFRRVDDIALKMGTSKEHPSRVRAGIITCVFERVGEGDCWVDYMELIELANKLLVMDIEMSRARVESELESLIEMGLLACESINGRLLVATADLAQMEQAIAKILREQGTSNPHDEGGSLGRLAERLSPGLNEKQQDALRAAARSNLLVITGPGGAGKSFLVASICKMYDQAGKTAVLAAPTGKAAKRLEQVVTDRAAQTLHRLLGYNSREFALGPRSPTQPALRFIDADAVIVDEVSMVDVPLAYQLLGAIDFRRTALVLVGDHNQLPPVGPGNLLRDLIDRRAVPTVILDQVVRQAGILKENSNAVLAGEVRKTAPREADGRSPWIVVNKLTDADQAQKYVLWLFESVIQEHLHFDLLRDVQLLTPQRKGPLGVDALNLALQRALQKKVFGVEAPAVPDGRRPPVLLHDRVIQTRNNYDLQVMNGAVGIVTEVGPKAGQLVVRFDDRSVDYDLSRYPSTDLQLAYATSIHRYQGSEIPCAVVIAHKSHAFMHHRNLLYTAVTRARQVAIIVGDAWGIRGCAAKVQVQQRRTFLSVLDLPNPEPLI